VDELLSLSKKFGINPAGEGGEYETLVVNAPFFKCRLRVKEEGKEWDGVRGDYKVNAPLAVYSEDFLKHRPAPAHPERPERLEVIVEALKRVGIWHQIKIMPPRKAKEEEVLLVHQRSYLELLKDVCRREIPLDGDTPTKPDTYEAALLAAGGTLVGAEEVLKGKSCFLPCASSWSSRFPQQGSRVLLPQ
jgi:hypothetical protein